MRYKIVLSSRGKEIYKGGNIEVLKPLLNQIIETKKYKVNAQGLTVAENILYYKVMETLGTGSLNLFTLEQIK